jgi:hypothetical protein
MDDLSKNVFGGDGANVESFQVGLLRVGLLNAWREYLFDIRNNRSIFEGLNSRYFLRDSRLRAGQIRQKLQEKRGSNFQKEKSKT